MKPLRSLAFPGALLLAPALFAQTLTIDPLPPQPDIYPGDHLKLEFTGKGTSLAQGETYRVILLERIWQGSIGPVEKQVSDTAIYIGSPTFRLGWGRRVPPVECGAVPEYPCPATVKTQLDTVVQVSIEYVISFRKYNGTELSRQTALTVAPRYPGVQVLGNPKPQPVNTKRTVRVRVPGARFVANKSRDFFVRFTKRGDGRDCYPGFNPGTLNCYFGNGISPVKAIDNETLEFEMNTTAGASAFSNEDFNQKFAGDYDAFVTWTEDLTPSGILDDNYRRPTVYGLNQYKIAPPLNDDYLEITKVNVSATYKSNNTYVSTDYVWTPGAGNFLDVPPGSRLQVKIEGKYRLDRYTQALIFAVLRPEGSKSLSPMLGYGYVRNTFENIEDMWDTGYSRKSPIPGAMDLPDNPTDFDLELLVVMTPPDQPTAGASVPVLNTTIAQSVPIPVRWGTPVPVTVDHIEVIQVAQTENGNTIPMIAGKSTVARVFPRIDGQSARPVKGVKGRLRAVRNGSDLPGDPVLLNTNPVSPTLMRTEFDDSLNFLLPQQWLTGDVILKATVWTGGTEPKPDSKNTKEEPVQFVRLPNWPASVRITYLQFCIEAFDDKTSQTARLCPGPWIANQHRYLSKILPIADKALIYEPLPMSEVLLKKRVGTDTQAMLERVMILMSLYSPGFTDILTAWLPGVHIVGRSSSSEALGPITSPAVFQTDYSEGYRDLEPADPPYRITKESLNPGNVYGFGWDLGEYRLTHMVGHLLGLRDTPGQNDDVGTCFTLEVGFDVQDRRLIRLDFADLMWGRYCLTLSKGTDSWIAVSDYKALINTTAWKQNLWGNYGSVAAKGNPKMAVSTDYLVLTGNVDASGAQLSPGIRVSSTASMPPSNPTGAYCLRFSGAGAAPPDYCFDLKFSADPAEPQQRSFTVAVPYLGGATRVALLKAGQEIASLSGGAQPPSLSIASPAPGSKLDGLVGVTWTASDPTGAALTHTLMYSTDGGQTWIPLAIDLDSAQFTLDAATIAGGSNVHFKVISSNGLNSAEATVGPVEVVQRPRGDAGPAQLAFPNVTLGYPADRDIAVTNSGSGPMPVTVSMPDNPALMLIGERGFTVPARSTHLVRVRYSPLAAGTLSAAIRVTVSDPDPRNIDVTVTGAAFAQDVPSIEIAEAGLKFGPVDVGKSKELQVTVTNAGRAPLKLKGTLATDPQFVAAPQDATVAPGAQQSLTVKFAPAAAGSFSSTLTIESDDPTRRYVTVPLSGTGAGQPAGAPSIELSKTSIDFGAVGVGKTSESTLTVRNTGNAALSVTKLTIDNALFSVVGTAAPISVAAGSARDLTLRFTPSKTGAESGSLRIESNDQTRPVVTVTLSGSGTTSPNTPPAISVNPSSLDFGQITVGQSKELSLNIKNTGGGSLVVSGVSSSNAAFVVTAPVFTLDASASRDVKVTFKPTTAGQQFANITVSSTDPVNPVYIVTASGRGEGGSAGTGARIDVTPARLDFGDVAAGSTKDLNLTATGSGQTPLSITSITSDNPRFRFLGSVPFSPGFGGTATIPIRFSPDAAGAQSGTITIASNAENQPAVRIPVTGTGVAAGPVLQVDDGTMEMAVGVSAGADGYYMNRLTPARYPATLKAIQIYFHEANTALEQGTDIALFSAANPPGREHIDGLIYRRIMGKVKTQGRFNEYPVSDLTIDSGDFVVGFTVQNPPNAYPAASDTSSPSQRRSFISTNGVNFDVLENTSLRGGNFLIRALVSYGTP